MSAGESVEVISAQPEGEDSQRAAINPVMVIALMTASLGMLALVPKLLCR